MSLIRKMLIVSLDSTSSIRIENTSEGFTNNSSLINFPIVAYEKSPQLLGHVWLDF